MADDVTEKTGATGDTAGAEESSLDMDEAVADIASGLGFETSKTEAETTETDAAAATDETADQTADTTEAATDTTDATAAAAAAAKRPMPKSWAKETQDIWDEMTPRAQEQYEKREKQMLDGLEQYKGDSGFGKTMRETTEPYKAFLTSQGVDAPKAVQFLLNAHYRLSTAQPQDRQKYFADLAKSYGIDLAALQPAEGEDEVDPAVQALEQRVNSLQTSLTAREQAALNEAKAKVAKDVEAFATDPKNQYFDECSDDIVALIQAGNTLQQAYEKSVYANPVTRAKELARLQAENEKTLREKAKTQAEAARKAAGTNVRSRDTRKAPTEPKGSMEDTMRATLKDIRERTH